MKNTEQVIKMGVMKTNVKKLQALNLKYTTIDGRFITIILENQYVQLI